MGDYGTVQRLNCLGSSASGGPEGFALESVIQGQRFVLHGQSQRSVPDKTPGF